MSDIATQWPAATLADFVDHIDYAVRLIGIDRVGISSDFDGGGGVVGWNSAAQTFNVTLELVRRGYSEAGIRKLAATCCAPGARPSVSSLELQAQRAGLR
jgi:membrane dipeptidase